MYGPPGLREIAYPFGVENHFSTKENLFYVLYYFIETSVMSSCECELAIRGLHCILYLCILYDEVTKTITIYTLPTVELSTCKKRFSEQSNTDDDGWNKQSKCDLHDTV